MVVMCNRKAHSKYDEESSEGSSSSSFKSASKHIFVSEPMGEKTPAELNGIGHILSRRLAKIGFDKAYVVFGQFLVLKKDRELFTFWLCDSVGASPKQANDCYQCLLEWSEEFL
ncbi:hypothetical protein R5R35_012187 [Gryllus longicercus]|uniref:Barrier-to-autointegration factor-like protein n=1 Tax=Gryllus longicercus TaxID=2509291 RepID=A0AAN9W2D9_9ORTH